MALTLIHLKKFESPLPKDGLNRTSGQRERERERERERDRQTDRQTDRQVNGQRMISIKRLSKMLP